MTTTNLQLADWIEAGLGNPKFTETNYVSLEADSADGLVCGDALGAALVGKLGDAGLAFTQCYQLKRAGGAGGDHAILARLLDIDIETVRRIDTYYRNNYWHASATDVIRRLRAGGTPEIFALGQMDFYVRYVKK